MKQHLCLIPVTSGRSGHFRRCTAGMYVAATVVRQYSVRRSRLDFHQHMAQESRPMPTLALFLFGFARLLFSGHAAVAAENAALRLQLAAFQRQRRRPVLTSLRPTILGRTLPAVEALALSPDVRPSRHGRPLAARAISQIPGAFIEKEPASPRQTLDGRRHSTSH